MEDKENARSIIKDKNLKKDLKEILNSYEMSPYEAFQEGLISDSHR